jgi:phosphopantothenoylcysteine decarboxylase/phosphopantothenate--cysteine ligase
MKSNRMHFLITAGGTREYIDPVRFISNASSGKMGYTLAQAAVKAGHKVTLISAPTSLWPPKGVKLIKTVSADDMFKAVKDNFGKCDCLIMAAAVSDYKPFRKSKVKIKKSAKDLIIKLKPTVDILKWAGKNKKKNQVIVGFALEDKNLRKNAERKLKEKKLDMIIANRPSAIGAEKSKIEIKPSGARWIKLADAEKAKSAGKILKYINRCFER